MPTDHANGMDERELVGIAARLVARLVHQLAQREMHQQQAIEFLLDQIDPMAAQDQAFAGQPHFELGQDPFVFPSLMVKRGQFRRRRAGGIEHRRDQPIHRLGVGQALEAIVDDAHPQTVAVVAAIPRRAVEPAQTGAIRQHLPGRQDSIRAGPPQQIGTRGAGALPQLVAEKAAIRQTQHSPLQPFHSRSARRTSLTS